MKKERGEKLRSMLDQASRFCETAGKQATRSAASRGEKARIHARLAAQDAGIAEELLKAILKDTAYFGDF